MNKKEENFRIPKAHLCKVRWKLVQWFGRRFLNFVFVFSHFLYYSILSPLEKWQGPSFEQTSFPSTEDVFVPSLFEIGPVVSSSKIFAISLLYSLGEGRGSSFLQKRIPFTMKDLSKMWLKLAEWFWKRIILNFVNVISPLGKGRDSLFEQTWIPFIQGC